VRESETKIRNPEILMPQMRDAGVIVGNAGFEFSTQFKNDQLQNDLLTDSTVRWATPDSPSPRLRGRSRFGAAKARASPQGRGRMIHRLSITPALQFAQQPLALLHTSLFDLGFMRGVVPRTHSLVLLAAAFSRRWSEHPLVHRRSMRRSTQPVDGARRTSGQYPGFAGSARQ
jgi:hypothetical protein